MTELSELAKYAREHAKLVVYNRAQHNESEIIVLNSTLTVCPENVSARFAYTDELSESAERLKVTKREEALGHGALSCVGIIPSVLRA